MNDRMGDGQLVQDNDSTYLVNYDNEEFYPEETPEEYQNTENLGQDETNNYKDDYMTMDPIDPDEQTKLEKTVFHKAMIGIGPYLVQKAASVLGASRSYSGDLSYLPKATGKSSQVISKEFVDKRKSNPEKKDPHKKKHSPERNRRYSHSHGQLTNSFSQSSFTKGFQKLRINGGQQANRNTQTCPIQSGGSTHRFKFQRGNHNSKRVNNKCSSTSSLGRGWKPTPKIQPENSIGQRLSSARKMQIKELKSRNTLLENLLKESRKENQTLTRMQHRHEIALSKYEGKEAELPKMIRSHVLEVRSLQENLRKVQNHNRSFDEKLKMRDQKIFRLEEENKTLISLVKQNNLEERSKLTEQLEQAKIEGDLLNVKVSELQRHVEILEKNHRHQINVETKKLRVTNNKLFEAIREIDKLVLALKEKERNLTCMRIRQGQMVGGTPTLIFRDDLSIRSARTIPLNKSTRMIRPTDQTSLNEQNVRRQRSLFESCDPHNPKPVRTKLNTNNTYFYESTNVSDNRIYDSCEKQQNLVDGGDSDIINLRHNNNSTNQSIHQPPSPRSLRQPSSRSYYQDAVVITERERRHVDCGTVSITPMTHRSTRNHLSDRSTHSYSRRISTDDKNSPGTCPDDEYFNFENVSVEEDDYRPHKSLYMDALDSSCNVSSVGQSPLNSIRSPEPNQLFFVASKNLSPSSVEPKFRLQKKQTPDRCEHVPSSLNEGQHDDMISTIPCPSALQSPSLGDLDHDEEIDNGQSPNPLKISSTSYDNRNNQGTGAGDGPLFHVMSIEEAEAGFISQRPSKDQNFKVMRDQHSHGSNRDSRNSSSSSSSSSSASDHSDQGTEMTSENPQSISCDIEKIEKFSPTVNSKSKLKSDGQLKDESVQNSPIIETMFTKWKKNKQNAFENGHNLQQTNFSNQIITANENDQNQSQAQEQKPETTPRRKEFLLQKMKEIDPNRKKTEEKVSLSNPAYFNKLNDYYDSPDILDKPSSLFKPSLYQPFFNNTTAGVSMCQGPTEITIPVHIETPSGRKVKNNSHNPLPCWLNVSNSSKSSSNDTKATDKSQETDGYNQSRIQHSSALEPKKSTNVRNMTTSNCGDLLHEHGQDFVTPPQEITRKKFSIATISSLQGQRQANVQPSTSLAGTKKGNIGIVQSKLGSSPSWK